MKKLLVILILAAGTGRIGAMVDVEKYSKELEQELIKHQEEEEHKRIVSRLESLERAEDLTKFIAGKPNINSAVQTLKRSPDLLRKQINQAQSNIKALRGPGAADAGELQRAIERFNDLRKIAAVLNINL